MNKPIILTGLAALLISAAALPIAARPPHGEPGGPGPRHEYMAGPHRHRDRPAPPPRHHAKKPKHHKKHRQRHYYSGRGFDDLVYRASYGSPNVQIYSMGNDVYVVRYVRNGRYYIRQINAIRNTMLAPQAITLDGRGWYLTANPSYYYVPNGTTLNLNIGSGRGPNININLPVGH